MTNKQKAIAGTLVLLLAFAAGRYSVPVSTKTTSQTTQTDTKSNSKSIEDDAHKSTKTTTTDITKPDGTKEHSVTQETDIDHDKKTSQIDADTRRESKTETTETVRSGGRLTVSALGMAKASFSTLTPDFGVLVSKDVVGPISIGAFGFKSGNIGIAIGLGF